MTGVEAWAQGYRLPAAALGAVVAVSALSLVTGARLAALSLAGILVVAALVRALVSKPGRALAIRSRWFDVGVLAGLAAVIGGLAATTAGV